MTAKLLASCLLLASAAAAQETPTVELNGGMQAQLLALGHQRDAVLTAAVKITNKGQDHVFLLLYGIPSAIEDSGGRFDVLQAVKFSGLGDSSINRSIGAQWTKAKREGKSKMDVQLKVCQEEAK
jgi:hypothetical protein